MTVAKLDEPLSSLLPNSSPNFDPGCFEAEAKSRNECAAAASERIEYRPSRAVIEKQLLEKSDWLLVWVNGPTPFTAYAPDVASFIMILGIPFAGDDNEFILVPYPLAKAGEDLIPCYDRLNAHSVYCCRLKSLPESAPTAEHRCPPIVPEQSLDLNPDPKCELTILVPNTRPVSELASAVDLVQSIWWIRQDEIEALIVKLREYLS